MAKATKMPNYKLIEWVAYGVSAITGMDRATALHHCFSSFILSKYIGKVGVVEIIGIDEKQYAHDIDLAETMQKEDAEAKYQIFQLIAAINHEAEILFRKY